MPYKNKNKRKKYEKKRRVRDKEELRIYHREYARARKAGIPFVNPVPKQRVNRKGIPVGIRVDITGRKFGRLEAIGFSRMEISPAGNGKQYFWNFKCDCGNISEINRQNVTSGKQKTCGKCRNGVLLTPEGCTRKSLFGVYRSRASKKGYEFTLTEEEFFAITRMACALCGLPPSQIFRGSRDIYRCVYTGIDRIDNELGYIQGNVRPCCKWCNMAKHAWTETQFQEWIDRIVKFRTTVKETVKPVGENKL